MWGFLMCGCFGNMCTCTYCVLYCLCCVFVLSCLCTFVVICFVCTSEGLLPLSDNSIEVSSSFSNDDNNNNIFKDPAIGPPTDSGCINKIHL